MGGVRAVIPSQTLLLKNQKTSQGDRSLSRVLHVLIHVLFTKTAGVGPF